MEFIRYLLLFSIAVHYIPILTSASCLGCVDLDVVSFYKLIPRFPYALVKFDIAFPYGEKHEAFGQFSRSAHQVTNDLLVGLIGIKDYGDKENSELGEKFNVDPKAYPAIYLFRGNSVEDYVKFPEESEITVENLKEFVTQNSNVYIGLDGCLKEFSELVVHYADKDEAEQKTLIGVASEMLDKVTDEAEKASAKVYIAFMKRILEKGPGFVKEETSRLTKLQKGKISETKKLELSHKLNILKSFKSKEASVPKSEL